MPAMMILTATLLSTAVMAQDLYRPDAPGVLAPPPAPPDPAIGATRSFAKTYAGKGRPRLVLFWNRAYADVAGPGWEDETVIRRSGKHKNLVTTETSGADPESGAASGLEKTMGGFDETTTITNGKRRVDPSTRAGAGEAVDWQLESGFRDTLRQGGVRLVDRAAASRQAGKDAKGDTPDLQALETKGLGAKADYILEVLMTPDTGSSTGWQFRVELKGIHSGDVVLSFVSDGAPTPSGQRRYVATSRGFEVAAERFTVADVGEALAVETMERAAASW
jgi:hypothetical protein